MTYPEALRYLDSFIDYEKIPHYPYKKSLKLERIKDFLAKLDNPQYKINCIHIAGTKGKGSTCAIIAYILKQAGFKVGLYTSPHLSDFRERIRILSLTSTMSIGPVFPEEFEGMISKDELVNLVEKLKPAIDEFNKNSKYGELSFFEVYTALAFEYFKEKRVNFAVLETGLGGRLDATNVVNPLVCGITSISFEHTQKLGNTLREIAREKAGIIKNQPSFAEVLSSSADKIQNLIVVSAPQEKEVQEVIEKRCKEQNINLYHIGRDIFFEEVISSKEGHIFNVLTPFFEYPHLKIRLLGRHQLINATLAVGIIETLRYYGVYIDLDTIRTGLYNTLWPARLEIVLNQPLIVLDGAQNVASSFSLKEAIKQLICYEKLILVLGISKDKDIKGICKILFDLADEVILTQADNPRAAEPKFIQHQASSIQYQGGLYLKNNIKEAIELAKSKAGPKDLILITGSLFVAGEARALLV